jgi:hypothetical protein
MTSLMVITFAEMVVIGKFVSIVLYLILTMCPPGLLIPSRVRHPVFLIDIRGTFSYNTSEYQPHLNWFSMKRAGVEISW